LYYHFDMHTAVALWEWSKNVMCVTMERNGNFVMSFTSHLLVFLIRWAKRQFIICFQKGPTKNTVQFCWKICTLEEINPKKLCHMCHVFCQVCPNLLLSENPSVCAPEKNESQVQKHSTHYVLRLEMYKNQLKCVLTHVVKCEN